MATAENDSSAIASGDLTSSAQQQLREFHLQLQQLDDFISSDPTNEQYLQTRDDLLTVISMTENLIDAQGLSDEDGEDHSKGGAGAGTSSQQQIENLHVGDHIEVISGERPYPAILLSLNPSTSECSLKYYEFGTEVTLSLHEIRKISAGREPRRVNSFLIKLPQGSVVNANTLQIRNGMMPRLSL
jgi:hypothetical protein